jgi:hypothetical protein
MKKTIALFALGMSVAYAQNLCQVSDGECAARQIVASDHAIQRIAVNAFTATAVVADSCTWCGRTPQ